MDKVLSTTFHVMRFPLALFVVFLHIDAMPDIEVLKYHWGEEGSLSIYYLIVTLVVVLANLAVPLFFFMSGFLMFVKRPPLTFAHYGQVQKKKLVSLWLPYVLWNLFAVPYLYVSTGSKLYSFEEIFLSPANFPLWFLRDLIFLFMIYPLLQILIQYTRWIGFVILAVVYVCGFCPSIAWLQFVSLFFFTWGGYCSWWQITPRSLSSIQTRGITIGALGLYAVTFLAYGSPWFVSLNRLFLMLGVGATLLLTYNFFSRHNLNKRQLQYIQLLSASSFFVYLSHKLGPTYLANFIFRSLEQNELVMILRFLIAPFLAVGICCLIYVLLSKKMPCVLLILLGRK